MTDFLTQAVSQTAPNPALEEIRDKGADVVMAVYRVAKIALVHSLDNDAVTRTIDQSIAILRDFGAALQRNVSVTFMLDTAFVCGELLRASRSVYESAVELGELLERAGATEVSFDPTVTSEALAAFAEALTTALRDPERQDALMKAFIPGIVVSAVEPSLRRAARDDLPARERIIQHYASALVVMRRFFDSLAAGSMIMPHRVKRVAQGFVALAESEDPAVLGLTALATAHRDDAGRAVQTAILSIVTARQITVERVPLSRLALAALVADAGRVRLAGKIGRDRLVPLSEQVDSRVPAASAGVCIASGGVNLSSALRAATTFEAAWIEREAWLGPLFPKSKLVPLVTSRILHVVRALLDRMAPRDTSRPMAPIDALQQIGELRSVDPLVFRCLVQAIGVAPAGSVVELESGEWAVVVGDSKGDGMNLDRPRIRLVTDADGRALEAPVEIDLGKPANRGRRIARLVDPSEARFNIAAVFLAEGSS